MKPKKSNLTFKPLPKIEQQSLKDKTFKKQVKNQQEQSQQ